MHRHRRLRLGEFGEALVCLKCRRVWTNEEELYKSRLMDLYATALGQSYPVFTDDELALLKSLKGNAE